MDDDGIIDVEAVIALMPDVIKDKVAPAIRTCGTKGKNIFLILFTFNFV